MPQCPIAGDATGLTSLSPYLAASPSISYFIIGTHIEVRNTKLSERSCLLKNRPINCVSSMEYDSDTDSQKQKRKATEAIAVALLHCDTFPTLQ